MAEVAKEGSIFDFFTGVNELSLQIIPIPVNCSSSGEVGTESPFSRSLLHWPIQLAAMANTASSIGHHSQLCEMGNSDTGLSILISFCPPAHPRLQRGRFESQHLRCAYGAPCQSYITIYLKFSALQMLILTAFALQTRKAEGRLSNLMYPGLH